MSRPIINVTLEADAWARHEHSELITAVKAIESAGATSVVFEDPDSSGGPGPWRWEPSTAVGALTSTTQHIGLVLPIASGYTEPFTASRRIGSLDHLSGGRVGWLLDPTQTPERDARTRAVSPDLGDHDPLGRAIELVEANRALWDEWEEGAFALDVANNLLVDVDRIRPANFAGRHFRVAGPSNLRRPPSGNPPLYVRVNGSADLVLAGLADVILAATPDLVNQIGDRRGRSTVLISVAVGWPDPQTPIQVSGADGIDIVVSAPDQLEALEETIRGVIGERSGAVEHSPGLRAALSLPELRK